jgi:hypothetical protein
MPTFIEQIREWLDTETQALLCAEPPPKLTAIGVEAYSLLLLKQCNDRQRIREVVAMIQEQNPVIATDLPFVVGQEMTLEEAMAGQFALACCDCMSAFVRDDVIRDAGRAYLHQLNEQVKNSSEFESVNVMIVHVPNSEEGRRFCWQFLGLATGAAMPAARKIFRKKARLMEHWARRSGVDLQVEESD